MCIYLCTKCVNINNSPQEETKTRLAQIKNRTMVCKINYIRYQIQFKENISGNCNSFNSKEFFDSDQIE